MHIYLAHIPICNLCIKYLELRTRKWCPWHWVLFSWRCPLIFLLFLFSLNHWKLPEVSATGNQDQEQTCNLLFLMSSSAISCFLPQPRRRKFLRALFSEPAACCRWLGTLQSVEKTCQHQQSEVFSHTKFLGCRAGVTDKLLSTLTLVTKVHLQKAQTIPVSWWRTTKWGWALWLYSAL